MLLFCTPSVGWLRWLFYFLSVHRGRLLLFSFIFGPSLRCIASVVCLGSFSATSLSLPFSVSVTLLSPLLSSARPTTFAFAAPLLFTASVAVVSVEPSSSEVTWKVRKRGGEITLRYTKHDGTRDCSVEM